MKIEIKSIDPLLNRYPTAGDWYELGDGTLRITTPDWEGNRDGAFLVAIHELVEAYLCQRDDVTEEVVTHWDKTHPHLDEPGDHNECPYNRQHCVAMRIERTLASAMGISWHAHDRWVERAAIESEKKFSVHEG